MKRKIIYVFAVLIAVLSMAGIFYYKNFSPGLCVEIPKDEKPVCWKDQFTEVAGRGGIKSAFKLIDEIYKKDPDFAPSCHDYTHLIGENAYSRYVRGEKFSLGDESTFCGYGFYHGFIISLLRDGREAKEAAVFCRGVSLTAGLDCFHGMGHGFVDFNESQLKSSENIQAVLSSGTDLCNKVGTTPEEVTRCKDGVYHSLFDIAIGRPELLEAIIPDRDPFFLCKAQNADKEICTMSASTVIMKKVSDDFPAALKLVVRELGLGGAGIIRQMAGYEAMLSLGNGKLNADILACKTLTGNLKEECIKGLVEGVTDFGEPGREEGLVRDFCTSPEFNGEEKDFCLSHAVHYFEIYFGMEKKQKLCEITDSNLCQ